MGPTRHPEKPRSLKQSCTPSADGQNQRQLTGLTQLQTLHLSRTKMTNVSPYSSGWATTGSNTLKD